MSITFQEFKKVDNVRKAIDARIEKMKVDLFLVDKVLNVVKKQDGQKITQRIATALKKEPGLEDYTIYYVHEFGLFKVVIWGNGREYDERFTSWLGHDTNPVVNVEQFIESNQCHFLDKERIDRLKNGKSQVLRLVKAWNNGIKKLAEVNKQAEAFELGYDFDLINRR